MKRKVLIFLLLISALSLFSSNRFALPFLMTSYSVYESSFGLNSGTANLRNLSPLAVQNNPAKLGAFRGISLGFQHQGDSDWSRTTTQAVLSYKGIGISFPAYGIGSGTLNKHRPYNGKIKGYSDFYSPKEYHKEFGIGTDVLQLWNNVLKNDTFEEKDLKLYFGTSLNFIYNKLYPDSFADLPETRDNDRSAFLNLGFIAEFTPIKLEGRKELISSIGIQFLNLNKAVVETESNIEGTLPHGVKVGISSTFSLLDEIETSFRKHAFVLHMMGDFAHYGDYKDVYGIGGEVTIFDVVSIRIGYTKDTLNNGSVLSNGLGLNANYKDKLIFSFNLIDEIGEGTLYLPRRADFSIGYNF